MGNNETVLVVEDDEDLLATLCSVLSIEGFRVSGVRNAASAHEHLRHRSPDVMLLDLFLDGRLCEEFLEELACSADAPPLVLCSATHRMGTKFSNRYAVSFIAKPFDVEQLVDAIEDAQRAGRRPSRAMPMSMPTGHLLGAP
jgi:two-component system nitrogen regulation response regulator NtrX